MAGIYIGIGRMEWEEIGDRNHISAWSLSRGRLRGRRCRAVRAPVTRPRVIIIIGSSLVLMSRMGSFRGASKNQLMAAPPITAPIERAAHALISLCDSVEYWVEGLCVLPRITYIVNRAE